MDVLEVSISTHGNRYLLVVQDYFTKWAEEFPMPSQTAKRITDTLYINWPVCYNGFTLSHTFRSRA